MASPKLVFDGVVVGILLGVPILTFVLTGQHRWLAVLALNAFYIVAYWLGGWPAALSSVFSSVLAILVSATLFRHSFADSTWEAFRYEIALGFGRTKGMQFVEDGKTTLPREQGRLPGPRKVVIRPENAVILEQSSRQTRVSGPGVITTEPFEYVRRIFDLRPRQRQLSIGDIKTLDHRALDLVIQLIYRIDIPQAMRLGNEAFGDSEKAIIREIDLWVPEWEQATLGVIESMVRQYVRSQEMAEMLKPGSMRQFEQRICRLSDDQCNDLWRVRVDFVMLQRVEPVR